MKKTNHFYRFCALALSCLLLISLLPVTQVLADGDGAIHIKSAEDLRSLAHSCTLDSWSRGKTVVLDNDIVLTDDDELPIPTFGGTFNGNSHTISGLSITQSVSPAGLFGVLQKDAVIKNLNVEGTVTPSGDSENIGGIVGENHGTIESCTFNGSVSGKRSVGGIAGSNLATGIVRACDASGAIFGQSMTGGIVGENLGSIVSCRGRAYVNIESTDPSIDLSNLNLEFSLDLAKLSRADTLNIATDTGGIAGYSSGAIASSTNYAAVGYQHIGYNIGGVVGRSSGQVLACSNEGAICGRKDVGGIAGQMEPYIRMEISDGLLQQLKTQLNELSGLVNTATNHAEGGSNEIASRLNSMSGYVDNAANELNNVRLNASIDSVITGDGSHSSDTLIGGGKGAAGGIDHEHSDSGHSTTIWGGSAAGAGASHEGNASGTVTGSTQIVAAPDLGGLTSSINGLSSQVTMLNNAASGTVGTLANDIRSINNKFNELTGTLFSAISSLSGGTGDIIVDTSDVDIDSVTFGKVSSCRNSGAVYGDVNTGGITGSMTIEYTLDPEDDVTGHLSNIYRKQYEYRSIIQKCVNTGDVAGKRSYVGGIVGRMDLGYLTACETSSCTITNENGSYTGGIAGLTGATVHGSFSKCTLSGKKYVGGIVGSGVQENVDGSGSSVRWNYSLVDITDCQQYQGAISGSDTGTFEHNYYVSDDLPGINRQGYTGRAEPISYAELLTLPDLPESMKSFTLTFVADDKTVLSRAFNYGDSIDESDIPEPPAKSGCHVHWDRTDLTNLHFDTVVTAVYEAYTPGLASEQTRESGQAVILVEGNYNDGDAITVTAQPLTPAAFDVQSGTVLDRVKGYFSCLNRGEMPSMVANADVLEQWRIDLADDGQDTHTMRYLPPDGQKELRIYTREDGGSWQEADCGTMGSYLTFSTSGDSVEFAAVRTLDVWGIWLGVLAVLAVLILIIVLLIHRHKRKARRRAEALARSASAVSQAEQIVRGEDANASTADEAPAKTGAPASTAVEDATQADAPVSAESTAVPAAVAVAATAAPVVTAAVEGAESVPTSEPAPAADPGSIEARLARAEEELRLLREEREARENVLTQPAVPPAPKKRRHRRFLPILITILVLLGAAAAFFLHSDFRKDLEAYRLVEARVKEDPMTMDVTVDASYGKISLSADASVARTKKDGAPITCIDRDGAALYYADGAIYLENGKSYAVGGAFPNYAELMDETAELCRTLTVTRSVDGQKKRYTLTAEGDDASTLLRLLTSDEIANAASLSAIHVDLTAESGELMDVSFTAENSGDLRVEAAVHFTDALAPVIPDDVLTAIHSGSNDDASTLTDNALRLLGAWGELTADDLSADIALSADCGPIVLNSTLQYDRSSIDGQSYGSIKKNTLAVYFSGSKICDADGNSVDTASQQLVDATSLIDLCYQSILNGSAGCDKASDGYLYGLSLDSDAMSELAAAIAPDIKAQDVTFSSGRISVRVSEQGELQSVNISCSGALHLILSDAPVSLSAVITPADRAFSIPQPALNALKQ